MLKADGWVGTPLRAEAGRYTGELAGPVFNAERKISYIEALVREWGGGVDWPRS